MTVEIDPTTVNYLDVNLNLNALLHKPYMKPNNQPVHIHPDSNHLTKCHCR